MEALREPHDVDGFFRHTNKAVVQSLVTNHNVHRYTNLNVCAWDAAEAAPSKLRNIVELPSFSQF